MAAAEVDAVPGDIQFEDVVMCVDCHPSKPIAATGCIDGTVTIHSYAVNKNECKRTHKHHKKSCRDLKFSLGGNRLYTAGKDKSLWCIDVETGGIRRKIKPAHETAINSLLVTGERFVVTGDDDGTLKLWDMRSKAATMELKECDDFISDMMIDQDQRILLAASGDGTLSAFNIRQKKLVMQSELHDSELLSLCAVKEQRKVVCGSGDGILYLFNWGEWGNMSDRFPGHPASITSMVRLTDDIVCTGSSDGKIRAVNILPNRFIGVVGEHEFDVEGLALSHDRQVLLSCSHDQCVKFWSVSDVGKEKINASKKALSANKSKKLGTTKQTDFFAGFAEQDGQENVDGEDDDDDEDDDSDDDSESD
ncbi:WD repeat-containing protein 55-like [Littorina saxatilis]|uniref:WD repeat-containing protein 55 n=1 Tax=Littorina saxatilis TaxID=31220 RepID=A0AAN9B2Q0_9CAEN